MPTLTEILCSHKINRMIGAYLARTSSGRGILKSAYEHNVPVYVPAFTDSEIGLDFALSNRRRRLAGKKPFTYDPFLDLEHYTERIQAQTATGIFTIGGGVPRELGAASRTLSGTDHQTCRPGRRVSTFYLWRAHLSRTRALGRLVRVYVFGRRVLGQICPSR